MKVIEHIRRWRSRRELDRQEVAVLTLFGRLPDADKEPPISFSAKYYIDLYHQIQEDKKNLEGI